jgi:hypothetical protein
VDAHGGMRRNFVKKFNNERKKKKKGRQFFTNSGILNNFNRKVNKKIFAVESARP